MIESQEHDGRNEFQHEDRLDFSRKNMLCALELFFSHTKYSITLLTTILAASMAVAAFSFDKLLKHAPDASRTAMIVAALFLLFMGPVSYISYRLVGRYYRLYVSCYIYAARMHEKYSSTPHPWFFLSDGKTELSVEELNKQDVVSDVINDRVVNFPNGGGRNSWYFYRWLIFILGAFGTCAGIFLLGWLLARP